VNDKVGVVVCTSPMRDLAQQHFAQRSSPCRKQKPADFSAGFFLSAALADQQEQDDQGNRNSDQPEKNGHLIFLSVTG
jgi:hypothetical protein